MNDAKSTSELTPGPVSVVRAGYDEDFIATAGANFTGQTIQVPRLEGWTVVIDRIAYVVNFPTFVAPPPVIVAHRIVIGWVLRGGDMRSGDGLVEMLKDDAIDSFFTLYPQAPAPRLTGHGDMADLQIFTDDLIVANPRRLTVAYHYERTGLHPCQAL